MKQIINWIRRRGRTVAEVNYRDRIAQLESERKHLWDVLNHVCGQYRLHPCPKREKRVLLQVLMRRTLSNPERRPEWP